MHVCIYLSTIYPQKPLYPVTSMFKLMDPHNTTMKYITLFLFCREEVKSFVWSHSLSVAKSALCVNSSNVKVHVLNQCTLSMKLPESI